MAAQTAWRQVIGGALLLGVVSITSTPGDAGTYINNRQDWQSLSPTSKRAFVMGVNDGLLGIRYYGDEGFKDDFNRCFLEMEMTSYTLADLVDAGYADVANWDVPASFVLHEGARKMCLPRINRYRAERGEEPLKP